MWRFEEAGPLRGDCTRPYKVLLDMPYSVDNFIKDLLVNLKDDWGYIGIKCDDPLEIFGKPNIQYSHGSLVTENFDKSILSKQIVRVTSDGGYSRMDYLITIK